jgi:hypothetical protein
MSESSRSRPGFDECSLASADAEPSAAERLRRIGFTATREGLTQAQRNTLIAWVRARPRCEGHHGDCIGGDEAFHATAQYHGWRMVSHPASGVGNLRSFTTGCAEVRDPKPPLDRNTDIVTETDELVACPLSSETLRSGTWATVRRARRARKPITLIWPDGRVTTEPHPPQQRGPTDAQLGPGGEG